MHRKRLLAISAIMLAVVCAGNWLYTHKKLGDLRRACIADTLVPITEMLKENAALTRELQTAPYAEGNSDMVSAYLTKVRRDGVPKHSGMKQRIDRLMNNNTAILALLAKYSDHANTAAFKSSAEHFRDYAISLRDRWQSVFEIFMAGGNLPSSAPLYPIDFDRAVTLELRANR